jgi:hypothetical protein
MNMQRIFSFAEKWWWTNSQERKSSKFPTPIVVCTGITFIYRVPVILYSNSFIMCCGSCIWWWWRTPTIRTLSAFISAELVMYVPALHVQHVSMEWTKQFASPKINVQHQRTVWFTHSSRYVQVITGMHVLEYTGTWYRTEVVVSEGLLTPTYVLGSWRCGMLLWWRYVYRSKWATWHFCPRHRNLRRPSFASAVVTTATTWFTCLYIRCAQTQHNNHTDRQTWEMEKTTTAAIMWLIIYPYT